jgi:hypothetical protein
LRWNLFWDNQCSIDDWLLKICGVEKPTNKNNHIR